MADEDPDIVFKALADKTRRALLDSLREHNGQTLGELCGPLAMARQSATQHLEVLEAANLIATIRRGREKLHYLNPVPLWEIHERWIERFEPPRLRALQTIKRQAEGDLVAETSTFVYVTYIETSAESIWEALTQIGSPRDHQLADSSGAEIPCGTVVESTPPHRLVMAWQASEQPTERISKVSIEIEPYHEIVRLTITHEDLDDDSFAAISKSWPAVLANLKSMLETGHVLARSPLEMPTEQRRA